MQSVPFKSARGEQLSGVVYRSPNPSSNTTTEPCILLVHGLMSDKTVPVLTHFVSQLTPHIACVMFDFPGQGESEGAFEYGGYQHQVDDVDAVIQQLAAQNLRVVCLIGHSMGGNIVLLHSAQHSSIPLVINLSARFDLERGILQPSKPADKISFEQNGEFEIKRKGKSFIIRKESIAERLRTKMSICANIKPNVMLLTFHGDVDEIIPHSDSQCLHALLTQNSDQSKHVYELPVDSNVRHTFITIQGSDHGYTKHAEQACQIAMQWLLPKLQTL